MTLQHLYAQLAKRKRRITSFQQAIHCNSFWYYDLIDEHEKPKSEARGQMHFVIQPEPTVDRGKHVFTVRNPVINVDSHIRSDGEAEQRQQWEWLQESPSIPIVEEVDAIDRATRGAELVSYESTLDEEEKDQNWQWLLED